MIVLKTLLAEVKFYSNCNMKHYFEFAVNTMLDVLKSRLILIKETSNILFNGNCCVIEFPYYLWHIRLRKDCGIKVLSLALPIFLMNTTILHKI